MKELKFFRCSICGKIVWEIDESNAVPTCCGQPMELLAVNTVEGAGEKHIPVAELTDGKLHVRVGSILHPSEESHHIEWIALRCTDRVGFRFVGAGQKPELSYNAECLKPVAVYAYCNLHGLWKGEVN